MMSRSRRARSVISAEDLQLDRALWDIEKWYQTRLGRLFFASERRVLRELVPNLFGYHLLQLSVTPERDLCPQSKISHRFALAGSSIEYSYCRQKNKQAVMEASLEPPIVTGIADWTELPFADESIDVCVLHHALEYTQASQQVLKEVARVLRPRGHIVIIGFNPYSFEGLKRMAAYLFSSHRFYQRRSLTQGRVEDWLDFLDCSLHMAVPVRSTIRQRLGLITKHRTQTSTSIRTSLSLLWALRPFAAGYALLACKDRMGARPGQKKTLESAVAPPRLGEPAVLSQSLRKARKK